MGAAIYVQESDMSAFEAITKNYNIEFQISTAGALAHFYDYDDASDGNYPFLAGLKERGISFSVYWEAVINEDDGGERHWRPGMDKDAVFYYGDPCVPAVGLKELKQAIEKGVEAVKAYVVETESKYRVPDWPCGVKTLVSGVE